MSDEIQIPRKPPPAAAMKEQLDSIAGTVTDLPKLLAHLARVLDEGRQTMEEALSITEDQGKAILAGLQGLQQRLGQGAAPRWYRLFDGFVLTVCGFLALGLGVLLGMRLASVPRYDQLALGVHAVLVQAYPTLPKAVQEQLSAVYKEQHITGPGQAQQKERK